MRTRILNFILKHLFNTITEEDILKVFNGKMYTNNTELSKQDSRSVVTGAATIKSLLTWELLIKEMKHLSNERIYKHSTNEHDLIFGKAMLYTISILESKIDKLSKMR